MLMTCNRLSAETTVSLPCRSALDFVSFDSKELSGAVGSQLATLSALTQLTSLTMFLRKVFPAITNQIWALPRLENLKLVLNEEHSHQLHQPASHIIASRSLTSLAVIGHGHPHAVNLCKSCDKIMNE